MALVGSAPFQTYGRGHWTTLFTTAPASPSTAGVPLPDGNRFVVELAVVTPANIDGSPAPTWVDITTRVSSLAFLTGDPAGRMSRWGIEQSTYVVKDLTDLVGDYIEPEFPLTGVTGPGFGITPADGPCPGSFIRWGIVRGSTWVPLQSHIIETISERTSGRVRGWQIEAFGTALYFAGQEVPVLTTTWPGTPTLLATLQAICNPSGSISTSAPWPWAETFAARNTTFPGSWGTAQLAIGSRTPKLLLLHQVADSMGQRLFNTPTGGLQTEDWTVTVASPFRFSDEPTTVVDGHGLVPGTLFGDLEWKRSQDRTAGGVFASLSVGTGVLEQTRYTKWELRNGLTGWPLTDIRSVPTDAEMAALAVAAMSCNAAEIRLDRIVADTARDAGCWSLLTGTVPLWPRSTCVVERRRPGVQWMEPTAVIGAVSGAIDFTTGVGHARLDYTTRLVAA